jgi:signal transduction histidine kinase
MMSDDPAAELDAVAAALAHDLRAPLRAIDGFSRILLGDDATSGLPEDTRRYLALVRDAGTELAELLDDLVDVVRIGRTTPARRDDVSVGRLARELVEAVLAERAPGVAWEIDDDALPPCRADPALLRRLLEELLDNAVKFGATRVEVGWDPGAGAYTVADDGIGVAGELPAQAYEIFGRLHARDAYPGTGAGLAIARRIAALHGGRVWVSGRKSGGACARFTVGG